jgi:histidine triad (HIT) family protein
MKDESCIFCKIVAGEIPAHKVYEDENFLGFLDITPRSPGHVQVIPKEHCRWVWDVQNAGEYFEVAKKIALAQQKAFNIEQIHAKIEGADVHHAHIWIFPDSRAEGDKMDFEINAEKIRGSI